jgi:predicted helicase
MRDDFLGETSLNAVLHWFLGRSTQWLSTGSAGEPKDLTNPMMTHRQGLFPNIFPVPSSEQENTVICLTDLAAEKPFMALATNIIPDLHLVGGGANAQCFPYSTYAEDGRNRRKNITDRALSLFQEKYGVQVAKWDIFHYVYAMLHHPQYRERYAENLKRDFPTFHYFNGRMHS